MENFKGRRSHSKQSASVKEYLPEIAVNLSTAALTWLFGVLVFLPIAARIDPVGLPMLISLIILSAFSLFLIKGSKGLGNVLNAASDVLAYEWTRRRKGSKEKNLMEKTKMRIKVALRSATIVIIYLLYSPLLVTIHPAINGIAVIITIMGILWTLLKKDDWRTAK